LVAGSFARGIFILDDISALREYSTIANAGKTKLFPIQPVPLYKQSSRVGSQGDAEWIGKNPDFGANFTYFMPEKIKSKKEIRQENEKKGTVKFPGWNDLEEEIRQNAPSIILVIKNSNGEIVNTVKGTNKKGFNRVNWNLSYPNKRGERLNVPKRRRGFGRFAVMVTPGDYTATLIKRIDGENNILQEPMPFKVFSLFDGALPRKSPEEVNLNKATIPSNNLYKRLSTLKNTLLDIDKELSGDKVKDIIGERTNPTASDGNSLIWRTLGNTYGPTEEHQNFLKRVKNQLYTVKNKLSPIINTTFPTLEADLKKIGAPWVEGQGLIKN